jgi:hypothetical protein
MKTSEQPASVPNFTQLANRLGFGRVTLWTARKNFGSHCPRPLPDGSHSVLAWREFCEMNAIGLKSSETRGKPSETDSGLIELKEREMRLKCEARELAIAEKHRGFIPADEIKAKLGPLFGQMRRLLSTIAPKAAAQLAGRQFEYHEAEEVVQAEINRALLSISGPEFATGLRDA